MKRYLVLEDGSVFAGKALVPIARPLVKWFLTPE
jgi:hypothetical protein